MNLVLVLLLLSIIHKFTVTIMNFVVKIVVDVDLLEKDHQLHGNCFDLDRPLKNYF